MILNNYKAMTAIESEYAKSNLSLELMFALHRQLTDGTEIPKDELGRLRTDSDPIVVPGTYWLRGIYYTRAAQDGFLNPRVKRLIDFANDTEGDQFVHQLSKPYFFAFGSGYLYPFTDGNGRMARSLFYWYLLKKGIGL